MCISTDAGVHESLSTVEYHSLHVNSLSVFVHSRSRSIVSSPRPTPSPWLHTLFQTVRSAAQLPLNLFRHTLSQCDNKVPRSDSTQRLENGEHRVCVTRLIFILAPYPKGYREACILEMFQGSEDLASSEPVTEGVGRLPCLVISKFVGYWPE